MMANEEIMGLAQYAVVAAGDEWDVLHDGNLNAGYATKKLRSSRLPAPRCDEPRGPRQRTQDAMTARPR